MRLARGTVVLLALDPAVGREQRGVRPAVIVSDAEVIRDQRFPLVAVVPVTSIPGSGALYPTLAAGRNGLTRASVALVDQIRSVDKRRIVRVYGRISPAEAEAIDVGLRLFLGLED